MDTTRFQGLLVAATRCCCVRGAASAAQPKQEEEPRVIPRLDQWVARVMAYLAARGRGWKCDGRGAGARPARREGEGETRS